VLLASSIQVLRRVNERYSDALHHRGPGNHYALTKVFAEEMGSMYAEHFGLEVIAARIGFMVRDRREAQVLVSRKMFDRYVSRRDVARFCHLAISAVFSGFGVLYAVGPDGRERFDLEAARRLIGYRPEDAWPQGLPFDASAL
jgi:uronate dehydrogenase